jgi:hypothetical protein
MQAPHSAEATGKRFRDDAARTLFGPVILTIV